jgi:hypothetical protein
MAKSRKHPLSEESIHEKEALAHKSRRHQHLLLARLTVEGKYEEEDWFEEEDDITRFEPIKRKKRV